MSDAQQQRRVKVEHDKDIDYSEYLQLDKLLSCVSLESTRKGNMAHDEHLFIVVHQVYELWFNQIIHELSSIIEIFAQSVIEERQMLVVISRMKRMVEIYKVMVDQMAILETMDALDFMDFRHYLVPASGFQSVQFRIIENKLGLRMEDRSPYQQKAYKVYFCEKDRKRLEDSEVDKNLFLLVEKWLERTPGLDQGDYHFQDEYKKAVDFMFSQQKADVEESIEERGKDVLLESLEKSRGLFNTILEEKEHNQLVSDGFRRLSQKAMFGALMIHLYREEPKYQLPFQFLTLLTEVDAYMTKWRYQHVQTVQKMIGSRLGTGGSSGYQYLRTTITDRYKVFADLFNIPTFLIPRMYLPALPKGISEKLSYSA